MNCGYYCKNRLLIQCKCFDNAFMNKYDKIKIAHLQLKNVHIWSCSVNWCWCQLLSHSVAVGVDPLFCQTIAQELVWILKASLSVRCMIFLNFPNKSHNMKALVILSHSWSPFFWLACLYGNNELLCVGLCAAFWSILMRKNSPISPMQITWPWPPVGWLP